MTTPHGHSSGGGSAGRAILLVVVAVALGAFLLARGFDGADGTVTTTNGTGETSNGDNEPNGDEPNGDGPSTEVTTTTSTTTTTTVPPVITHPPGEVQVVVANGTGITGRAGRTASQLNAKGYVTSAENTEASRVDESLIYYRPGYGDDAKAIASVLKAPADRLAAVPGTIMSLIRDPEPELELFNVYVVIGQDDLIPDPDPPPPAG